MMVTVITITYNHEPYIRECLEGIVSQRTTFPFELLIHDDASTDGTADIIREYEAKYPDIVKPIYQTENQYSRGVPIGHTFLYPRAQGKYIAECEGDDYWTDPLKLQKQVDFLESHPDYGMCYTDFNIYYQSEGKTEHSLFVTNPEKYQREYKTVDEWVLRAGYVAPPTWLVRKEIIPIRPIPSNDGTFVFFAHYLATSKVWALPDVTATYRILNESAAHSKDYEKIYLRNKLLLDVKYRLIEHYHLNPALREQCRQRYYRLGLGQFVFHNKKEEIETARRILKDKGPKERILFLIDALRLNGLARFVYRIVKKQ